MSSGAAASPGLDSGRSWTALPEAEQALEWSLDPEGAFCQGPLDMCFFRGRKVFLNLAQDELALLVEGHELRAVYLDGGHILDVGTRPGQVGLKQSLIFLAAQRLPVLRWTFGNPIALPGTSRRHIIGSCELTLCAPSRFFATFLAQPDQRDTQALGDALEKAVRGCLVDYLAEACPAEGEDAAGLQSTLMNLQAETLSEELASCGLACTHLALYTAQPPVEDWADSQDTAGHSPHLAHN